MFYYEIKSNAVKEGEEKKYKIIFNNTAEFAKFVQPQGSTVLHFPNFFSDF